jgi:hypothetical protein
VGDSYSENNSQNHAAKLLINDPTITKSNTAHSKMPVFEKVISLNMTLYDTSGGITVRLREH